MGSITYTFLTTNISTALKPSEDPSELFKITRFKDLFGDGKNQKNKLSVTLALII